MQTVVKHSGHLLRSEAFRVDQVRSPDVADEKRIAGQDFLRLTRGPGVGDQNGDAFGRVAGSLNDSEIDFADSELVAVFGGRVIENRAGFMPEDDLRLRVSARDAVSEILFFCNLGLTSIRSAIRKLRAGPCRICRARLRSRIESTRKWRAWTSTIPTTWQRP